MFGFYTEYAGSVSALRNSQSSLVRVPILCVGASDGQFLARAIAAAQANGTRLIVDLAGSDFGSPAFFADGFLRRVLTSWFLGRH